MIRISHDEIANDNKRLSGNLASRGIYGMAQHLLRLALSRDLMRRAALTAAIVGPAIAMINHGDLLFAGEMTVSDWLRAGVSFLVPYSVSTISSILTLVRGRAPDD